MCFLFGSIWKEGKQMKGIKRYISGYGKIETEGIDMIDNMLSTELLNEYFRGIGGIVMKAFKTLIGLVKKAFKEEYRAADFYGRNEKQYGPVFETTESYYYMEQLIRKYKPAE
jgi:hypothetical protein